MLRVLTLATLFPDATRPDFGGFVGRQTSGLAAHPDVALRTVAPVGLPPFPLNKLAQFASLTALPRRDMWRGLVVYRPRFLNLPATAGRFHVAAMVRALTPLLTTIRRDFAFDVIDAEFFFPDGPAAVALGRHFGVPVSIKARGSDIHHWGVAPATARQVVNAGRSADGCLAVSSVLRDDMAALGISADRIRIHRTGIDAERFALRERVMAKAALGIDGPLVVSVGNLIERKGHAIVIDAVQRLPGVHLLIAGAGPARAALESRIAAAGLGNRVRLLGAVPHGELPAVFAAADVMALASQSEGLANVWVESLASGTPIVITEAGGAREVVDRPSAGRMVARTPEAFAGGIAELLMDPPPQAEVRAAAAKFSWATNTAELYAHLSDLVARYRAQSKG